MCIGFRVGVDSRLKFFSGENNSPMRLKKTTSLAPIPSFSCIPIRWIHLSVMVEETEKLFSLLSVHIQAAASIPEVSETSLLEVRPAL